MKGYDSKSDKMKQLSCLMSEAVLLEARRLRRLAALLLMITFTQDQAHELRM